jgi:LPS-assembly lipoprotein
MRRRALLVLAAGSLGGCGFHAVYAPQPNGDPSPAQVELAAIDVAIIPDRFGQEMRQALQARLEASGLAVAKRYQLTVAPGLSETGIAIEPDTSVTRIRVVGTGTWTLRSTTPPTPIVTSGTSRVLDGYNLLDNQPFASDLEGDTVLRRVAEALADQITIQLAAFFDRQARARAKS